MQITVEQAVSKLFRLRFEAVFNEREKGHIYSLENDYDSAKHGIYGTIEAVQLELEKFLNFYRDYSFENLEQWSVLDNVVDGKLEEEYLFQLEQNKKYNNTITQGKKPWWKFW